MTNIPSLGVNTQGTKPPQISRDGRHHSIKQTSLTDVLIQGLCPSIIIQKPIFGSEKNLGCPQSYRRAAVTIRLTSSFAHWFHMRPRLPSRVWTTAKAHVFAVQGKTTTLTRVEVETRGENTHKSNVGKRGEAREDRRSAPRVKGTRMGGGRTSNAGSLSFRAPSLCAYIHTT